MKEDLFIKKIAALASREINKENLEFENFLKENKVKYEMILVDKLSSPFSSSYYKNIYKITLRYNRKRFTFHFGDTAIHSATGKKPEIRSAFECLPYGIISKSFMSYKEYCTYQGLLPFTAGKIDYTNYKYYKKDKNLVENLIRLFGIEFLNSIREKIKSLID